MRFLLDWDDIRTQGLVFTGATAGISALVCKAFVLSYWWMLLPTGPVAVWHLLWWLVLSTMAL
jgi:hypothetical protein